MFKRIFAMIVAVFLIVAHPVSATANNGDNTALLPAAFVEDAVLSVMPINEGCFEISLSKTEPIGTATIMASDEATYRHSVLMFVAESASEKEEILSRINLARRGGGTIYEDDTFFGNSCYIYISVTYTTRPSSIGTEARMSSVSTQYSVNSGTYVSAANLHLECLGTSSTAGAVFYEHDIAVTSSSYTTTYPSAWPYIYTGSPHLGAHFEVTATRASGESQTRTVGASVF
jgi:hypothetical protein